MRTKIASLLDGLEKVELLYLRYYALPEAERDPEKLARYERLEQEGDQMLWPLIDYIVRKYLYANSYNNKSFGVHKVVRLSDAGLHVNLECDGEVSAHIIGFEHFEELPQ